MSLMRLIFTIVITMGIAIGLITMRSMNQVEEKPPFDATAGEEKTQPLPSKRVSRFLEGNGAEYQKNQRQARADHCHNNHEVCSVEKGYSNSTYCCNNKCVDLNYDNDNCGACKNKCGYTQACCRGHCVYLALDKRHCGKCNNRCPTGEYCIYGLCNYA